MTFTRKTSSPGGSYVTDKPLTCQLLPYKGWGHVPPPSAILVSDHPDDTVRVVTVDSLNHCCCFTDSTFASVWFAAAGGAATTETQIHQDPSSLGRTSIFKQTTAEANPRIWSWGSHMTERSEVNCSGTPTVTEVQTVGDQWRTENRNRYSDGNTNQYWGRKKN